MSIASSLVSIFSHPKKRHTSGRRPRILLAVTSPQSSVFFRGQLAATRRAGFDVTLMCQASPEVRALCEREGARFLELGAARGITPLKDIGSVFSLFRTFRREQFDVINVGTPKAGFLCVVAGRLARVPSIIHTLRGLRHTTMRRPQRTLVWASTLLTCRLADKVICVSGSLRDVAVSSRVVSPEKAIVLGAGSSNGVDIDFFERTPALTAQAKSLKRQLGCENATVVGFVGRVARDKGLAELVAAWRKLKPAGEQKLLIVGEADPTDPLDERTKHFMYAHSDIHWVGHQSDPRPYYAMMDFLVLPTYREGLVTVPLEAGVMGIPTIGTTATGCVDAVLDDITGRLVAPGDVDALTAAISEYIADPALRKKHGAKAARRVRRLFRQDRLWHLLHNEYYALINQQVTQDAKARRAG